MNLVEIGYFSKTHGIKGQLILKSDSEFYFEEVNAFFVEISGSKAPFFIKDIKENNNGLIILLEEFDTQEKAKTLIGKKVFVDEQFIAENENEHNWLDYELIDHNLGNLGKINEVNESGPQILVSLIYKEKEIMLPLVEELIENIDEEGKKIHYKSPEGLIDLYLSDK